MPLRHTRLGLTPRLQGRYWVFFAGLTDVEFPITVVDPAGGLTSSFDGASQAPLAINDTSAFATCP